jgi:hypothetical protein
VATVTNTCSSGCGPASATSSATNPILPAAPSGGSVSISGSAQVGNTLIAADCSVQGWSPSTPAPSCAYQWQVSADGTSSWSNATGLGASTAWYTVASSDDSQYLRVTITATNPGGSGVVSSAASQVLAGAGPTGAAGPTGTNGATGANGTTGDVGPTGLSDLLYGSEAATPPNQGGRICGGLAGRCLQSRGVRVRIMYGNSWNVASSANFEAMWVGATQSKNNHFGTQDALVQAGIMDAPSNRSVPGCSGPSNTDGKVKAFFWTNDAGTIYCRFGQPIGPSKPHMFEVKRCGSPSYKWCGYVDGVEPAASWSNPLTEGALPANEVIVEDGCSLHCGNKSDELEGEFGGAKSHYKWSFCQSSCSSDSNWDTMQPGQSKRWDQSCPHDYALNRTTPNWVIGDVPGGQAAPGYWRIRSLLPLDLSGC